MIIKTNNSSRLIKQFPETDEEVRWYQQHMKEHDYGVKNNCCPTCKHELKENEELFDLGFEYGYECPYCR